MRSQPKHLVCTALLALFATWMMATNQASAWPIPDTGQTTSYTTTFGEDADYTTTQPSYTDNGNGTVTDNVTQLVWQQTDDGVTRTWDQANSYCEGLTLGGASNWRLPTVHELDSLVKRSVYNPAINSTVFLNSTIQAYYWTISAFMGGSAYAWGVYSSNGIVNSVNKTLFGQVRCVRTGSENSSFGPLLINNSSTATDVSSGLTWQRQDDEQTRSWQEALNYCESLSLDGLNDWRLPTANELFSLVDISKSNPAIENSIFTGTKSTEYWSSTTFAYNSFSAWYVGFDYGYVGSLDKSGKVYVRCVRGGPLAGALGSLIISSPLQAATVNAGSTINISWDTKSLGGQVTISLSRQSGQTDSWEVLSSSAPNDGSYVWTVTGPASTSTM